MDIDGNPLENANIELLELSKGTSSDKDGFFLISNISGAFKFKDIKLK